MIPLALIGAMTNTQTAIFGPLALIALAAALGVVLHRNPVVQGLFLVTNLLAIAGIYVLLGAYFFAAIQVLVYAGAVMVLIIFVIMLLNLLPEAKGGPGLTPTFFALLLALGLVSLLVRAGYTFAPPLGEAAAGFGSVAQVGRSLFLGYFYPFEVISLALVAAMAGAILLAKRDLEG